MFLGRLIPALAWLAKIVSKRCIWWEEKNNYILDFSGAVLRNALKKKRYF